MPAGEYFAMVKKQVEIDDTLGEEEQRSNKSSILDASRDGGVRRRGGSSMAGTDMMDEIYDILRDEDGSSLGGREEEAVEAVIEFGRAGAWWGCCCRDLNRLLLKIKTKCLFLDNRNQVCFFSHSPSYVKAVATHVEACEGPPWG